MFIILHNSVEGKIWGSWNNWTYPLFSRYPDFTIQGYNFFIINNVGEIEYKIENNDHFSCIPNYFKKEGEFENNIIYFDNGYFKNGLFDYTINFGFLQVWKHDNKFFEGEIKNGYPHGFGYEYSEEVSYEGSFCNGLKHGEGTFYFTNGEQKKINYLNNVLQKL